MKIPILSTLSLLGLSAFAQLTVDTNPQMKNVVLEEFTGIYCGFCPDGHKKANDIKAANPDDVVLINIHTGSYANPQSGDPDFRTPFGSAIAGQTGLTGYPAGTVNRHVFSGSNTAMGRSAWAGASSTILTQASYVNMAMEAKVNVQTRELEVKVKAYFTGNGAANNKINIALLQSHVAGPQSGASGNASQILPNGQYEHNHMLRHLLTGQWGEAITTTTQGTTYEKTFTYTIPADLNGVDYELGNLEVAAFITEGQQEIITGVDEDVALVVPAGVEVADFASANETAAPNSYCMTSVTPKVKITNDGPNPVAGFKASYQLNGGTKVYETVNNTLASGASTTVTFPAVTLSDKSNKLDFDVEGLSATVIELSTSNNASASETYFNFTNIGTSHEEGFESASNIAELEKSVAYSDGVQMLVVSNSSFNGVSHQVGAYEESDKTYMFNFFSSAAGKKGTLTYENIDFSTGTNHGLVFDHAYAQYNGSENDAVKIKVSTDCGATWQEVKELKGSSAATSSPSTSIFVPTKTKWKKNIVDLTAYTGQSDVMVQFEAISAYGNAFYLDNVKISANAPISVENNDVVSYSVYPNPASGVLNVKGADVNGKTFKIYDVAGKVIISKDLAGNAINISDLSTGVYTLDVEGERTKFMVK